MNNYYELKSKDLMKYKKEFSKTGYAKKFTSILLAVIKISLVVAAFLLVATFVLSFFENVDDIFTLFIDVLIYVICGFLFLTIVFSILKYNKSFKRWLKIKYNVEY